MSVYKWQLPVKQSNLTNTDWIHPKAKYHLPSCDSVDQMKEKNKQEYTGTREEIIDMGYDPCGSCKP